MKLTKEAFQNLSHLKLHREGKEEEGGYFSCQLTKKKVYANGSKCRAGSALKRRTKMLRMAGNSFANLMCPLTIGFFNCRVTQND